MGLISLLASVTFIGQRGGKLVGQAFQCVGYRKNWFWGRRILTAGVGLGTRVDIQLGRDGEAKKTRAAGGTDENVDGRSEKTGCKYHLRNERGERGSDLHVGEQRYEGGLFIGSGQELPLRGIEKRGIGFLHSTEGRLGWMLGWNGGEVEVKSTITPDRKVLSTKRR